MQRKALVCPRCEGPMHLHNGRGRRPECCEKCRTPTERRVRDGQRRHNEKVRKAKVAAKAQAEQSEPTTFGQMR